VLEPTEALFAFVSENGRYGFAGAQFDHLVGIKKESPHPPRQDKPNLTLAHAQTRSRIPADPSSLLPFVLLALDPLCFITSVAVPQSWLVERVVICVHNISAQVVDLGTAGITAQFFR
jgi:hypothetical protein